MNIPSFYRKPWDKTKVDWLIQWWPHYSTYHCALQLDLTRRQVKAKVDKLGLHLLPKTERLCVICSEGYQVCRYMGLRCSRCHKERRKDIRRSFAQPNTPEYEQIAKMTPRGPSNWFKEMARTARHRTKHGASDINAEYLLALWDEQKGRCHYTGEQLMIPVYKGGRRLDVASLDRLDSSKGYMRGNVVWCMWACNSGKSTFTKEQYIDICRKVVAWADQPKESHDNTYVPNPPS